MKRAEYAGYDFVESLVERADIPAGVDRFEVPFKRALAVAVATGIGYGFDSYAINIYSIVLPAIRADLGISLQVAGLIGTIFLVGYTWARSDRYRRRPVRPARHAGRLDPDLRTHHDARRNLH
jgi:hypothetical protein